MDQHTRCTHVDPCSNGNHCCSSVRQCRHRCSRCRFSLILVSTVSACSLPTTKSDKSMRSWLGCPHSAALLVPRYEEAARVVQCL